MAVRWPGYAVAYTNLTGA